LNNLKNKLNLVGNENRNFELNERSTNDSQHGLYRTTASLCAHKALTQFNSLDRTTCVIDV